MEVIPQEEKSDLVVEKLSKIKSRLEHYTKTSNKLGIERSEGTVREVIRKTSYQILGQIEKSDGQILYKVKLGDTHRDREHRVTFAVSDLKAIRIKEETIGQAEKATFVLK